MPGARILDRLPGARSAVYKLRDGADLYALKMFVADDYRLRERTALNLLQGDPRVPEIAAHGIFPWGISFLLTRWREGTQLAGVRDAAVQQAGFAAAALQLGAIARVADGAEAGLPLTRLAHFIASGAEVDALLAPITPLLGEAACTRIAQHCSALISELRADPGHCFCHGDYQPKNLLVGPAGELLCVLDWEYASIGTRWEDRARLLRSAPDDVSEQAIAREYGSAGAAEVMQRCRASDLLHICLRLGEPKRDSRFATDRVRLVRALLGRIEGAGPEETRAAALALNAQG